MKRPRHFLRSFFVLLILLTLSRYAQANDVVRITGEVLNVRSGPSTNHAAIGRVTASQYYVAIGTAPGWYKIWYDNRLGWISSSYVTPDVSHPWIMANTATLNVRSGPGTGYAIVDTTAKPASYAHLGCSGDWSKIDYGGNQRWIHRDFVIAHGVSCGNNHSPAPTPSPPASHLPHSSVGFVQLPGSGSGYHTYSPSSHRWGTPTLVYGLMNAARAWAQHQPSYPRMGIGDISLAQGGHFPPHVSHRVGKDVDIQPIASNRYEGPLTVGSGNYSSLRTDALLNRYIRPRIGAKIVLFNDPKIYNKYPWIIYHEGHYNHFHYRIE